MRESILIQRKRSIRADTALLNAVCLRSAGSVLRVGALLPTGRMPCPGILKKRAQKGGEILLKHASGVQQNAMRLKKSRLPYGREMHDSFRMIVPPPFRSDGPSQSVCVFCGDCSGCAAAQKLSCFSQNAGWVLSYMDTGGENVLAVSCPHKSFKSFNSSWKLFRSPYPDEKS